MTLRDAIHDLNSLRSSDTLFVAVGQPLHADISTVVAEVPEDDSIPTEAAGHRILLDVSHVRDVLSGKARVAGLREEATLEQKLAFLIQYATSGA